MFFKIVVLKTFAIVKHLCWSLFLIKLKKEAPAQVFSYEHCEIFKNSFHYRTTTSGSCFCRFDKVANCSVLGICLLCFFLFFSMWVFFHKHSLITGLQGKGEGIYLSSHLYFHPLHRHLEISRGITAGGWPLRIASSRTWTGTFGFRAQVANH